MFSRRTLFDWVTGQFVESMVGIFVMETEVLQPGPETVYERRG
jgi:hypothetical protein